jgi:L1 cell adhesion molecule like protein
MPPKKPIGIDLGTTFSCIAVQEEENKVKVILNDSGAQTTPSCVAFTDRESLVGSSAMNQCAKNPTNTVFDAKRLIGRKITDEHVQADMKLWPFKVVDGGDGVPLFEVTFKKEKKQFKPEEISSMVLIKLKSIADKYLGDDGPCEAAVITVPAYFN